MFNNGFERHEFACQCGCGFNTVDIETLFVLEELRVWFGKPVTIISGCRCWKHNEEVKKLDSNYVPKTSKSQHLFGRAVDISVKDVSPRFVYEYLNQLYPDKYGVGKYKTFTHLDTRPERARW